MTLFNPKGISAVFCLISDVCMEWEWEEFILIGVSSDIAFTVYFIALILRKAAPFMGASVHVMNSRGMTVMTSKLLACILPPASGYEAWRNILEFTGIYCKASY